MIRDEFPLELERYELRTDPDWHFELRRRTFLQLLGAGVLISVLPSPADAQERGGRSTRTLGERLHLGTDGVITVLCGKVEVGQGARTEVAMAAAEELQVPLEQIRVMLADTRETPDDGGTYGSRTTPSTIPSVRAACAAARELRVALAAGRGVAPETLRYADLAAPGEAELRAHPIDDSVRVTPVGEWKVLGRDAPRADGRAIVTGAHRYPSDVVREGMLRAAVLRPPSIGATLETIDLEPARAIAGVVAVRDGDFVGFAAPTSFAARAARDAAAATARWKSVPQPSSAELFDLLVRSGSNAGGGRGEGGGRGGARTRGSPKEAMASAARVLRERYQVAYLQHAPMEPRAAVAEWDESGLTVWTGTQNPSRVREELMQAFQLSAERTRVVVPDTGGAFGGKHTGEVAVEAARIAREAKRPVALQWSREEEFAWAYFRPAGVIEVAAGLDADGRMQAWEQRNWNSGGAALETPYAVPNALHESLASEAPLRQGSYRGLAATANVFARESFTDEVAHAAGVDPLEFRLRHLEEPRLRAVLERAAEKFDWKQRRAALAAAPEANAAANAASSGATGSTSPASLRGIGLACATEKGSFVAACVELAVDVASGRYRVTEICEAFECGAILNPGNLRLQVEGCIVQGLGGALREEIRFRDGVVENARFSQYLVPRFRDVPPITCVLLDRPDLPSAGAGETPIVAVAPAIANALAMATGTRIRSMPIRDGKLGAE